MKETEEDRNRWKDVLCSWIRRINIIKESILPNIIYMLSLIPVKMLTTTFPENKNSNSETCNGEAEQSWGGKKKTKTVILQSYSNQNNVVPE